MNPISRCVAAAGLTTVLAVAACGAPPTKPSAELAPPPAGASIEQQAAYAALKQLDVPGSVAVAAVVAPGGKSVCGTVRRPDGQLVAYQVLVSTGGTLMHPGADGETGGDRRLIDQFNEILKKNCSDLGADIQLGG